MGSMWNNMVAINSMVTKWNNMVARTKLNSTGMCGCMHL